jgi:hypothetical protein
MGLGLCSKLSRESFAAREFTGAVGQAWVPTVEQAYRASAKTFAGRVEENRWECGEK